MKHINLETATEQGRDPFCPKNTYPTCTPTWKAFADYFERREGFKPSAGDFTVERLYNYYIIGACDFEQGLHRAIIPDTPESTLNAPESYRSVTNDGLRGENGNDLTVKEVPSDGLNGMPFSLEEWFNRIETSGEADWFSVSSALKATQAEINRIRALYETK